MRRMYFSHLMKDEEAIALLEEYPFMGLENIDFGIGFSLDQAKATGDDYEKRMGEWTRKRPFSVHGPFLDLNPASFDSLIAEATDKRFRQAYELAERFGADRIVYHSGFNPQTAYEEGWCDQAAMFWKRFLEPLDGSIQVHVENVLDPHADLLLGVLERIDCPFFTACVDVGHAACYSENTPEEYIRLLGSHIGHLHFHDNHGTKDEHLALGTGTLPMDKLLKLTEEYCPEASVTLEHTYSQSVRESLRYLKEHNYL